MRFFPRISRRSAEPTPPSWALFRPLEQLLNGNDALLAIPTVGRCIELIAGDIARIPCAVETRTPTGWVPVESSICDFFDAQPNDLISGTEYRGKLVRDLLIHGSHLDVITRNGRGEILTVTPCEPGTWGYAWDPKTQALTYQAFGRVYLPEDVFHFRRGEQLMFAGKGVLDQYRSTLEGVASQYQAGARVFKTALPKLVCETPEPMGSSQVARLKNAMASGHGDAAASWQQPIVVTGGMKVHDLPGSRLDQSQWSEGLKQSLLDCANMFGVPASLVDDSSTPTDEHMSAYIEQCLRPLLASIEGQIRLKVLPPGQRIRFQTAHLSRGTVSANAAAQRALIDAGIQTPNEARAACNLPPSVAEGMDEVYLSKNYSNISPPGADIDSADASGGVDEE